MAPVPQQWLDLVEAALRARPGTRQSGPDELQIRCLEAERHKAGDAHPSAGWNIPKGTGGCHGCGAAWSTKRAAELVGVVLPSTNNGGSGRSWDWAIRDRDGHVQAIHHRWDDAGKHYSWSRPNGQSKLGGRPVASLPLYGAHLLPGYDRSRSLIVTEGEKAADSLLGIGIQAVGTVTGAEGCPSSEVLADLKGFHLVALWPDNDPDHQGDAHMRKVGAGLVAL